MNMDEYTAYRFFLGRFFGSPLHVFISIFHSKTTEEQSKGIHFLSHNVLSPDEVRQIFL